MPTALQLEITKNTFLKSVPFSSQRLKDNKTIGDLFSVKSGLTLDLNQLEHYRGDPQSKVFDYPTGPHYFVDLDQPIGDRRRWFIWHKHAVELHATPPGAVAAAGASVGLDEIQNANEILNTVSEAALKDAPPEKVKKDLGMKFTLRPELGQQPKYAKQPMWTKGKEHSSFTWGELFQNDPRRIPYYHWELNNAIKLAHYLDHIRSVFAQPIRVTSGPRPEPINRSVGGARNSYHTKFGAADIRPIEDEITLESWKQMCKIQYWGGLACGSGFFHVEAKDYQYARGYRTSWRYGGAPEWSAHRYY